MQAMYIHYFSIFFCEVACVEALLVTPSCSEESPIRKEDTKKKPKKKLLPFAIVNTNIFVYF